MISVLIPNHGRPELLAEAYDSVRHQANVEVEVVIGADPTGRGQSWAVNQAFARSTGEQVLVLDDDDFLWRTDALALLLSTLAAHPEAGAVFSLPQYVDALGLPIETPPRVLAWAAAHPVVTAAVVRRHRLLMHGGGILYRRAWWERAGPWDEALPACQEWEFRLRLLALGLTYVGLPVVTVAYRIHKGQLSARGGRIGRRSAAHAAVRQQIDARYALQEV
jgi:glycosyltransferase involved in cell wall biosynthesis